MILGQSSRKSRSRSRKLVRKSVILVGPAGVCVADVMMGFKVLAAPPRRLRDLAREELLVLAIPCEICYSAGGAWPPMFVIELIVLGDVGDSLRKQTAFRRGFADLKSGTKFRAECSYGLDTSSVSPANVPHNMIT